MRGNLKYLNGGLVRSHRASGNPGRDVNQCPRDLWLMRPTSHVWLNRLKCGDRSAIHQIHHQLSMLPSPRDLFDTSYYIILLTVPHFLIYTVSIIKRLNHSCHSMMTVLLCACQGDEDIAPFGSGFWWPDSFSALWRNCITQKITQLISKYQWFHRLSAHFTSKDRHEACRSPKMPCGRSWLDAWIHLTFVTPFQRTSRGNSASNCNQEVGSWCSHIFLVSPVKMLWRINHVRSGSRWDCNLLLPGREHLRGSSDPKSPNWRTCRCSVVGLRRHTQYSVYRLHRSRSQSASILNLPWGR